MKTLIDQKMPMRDGVLLNYDRHSPDKEGVYPVLLLRTPYTKQSVDRESIYANYRRFAEHGYHVIIQECRGTGLSEGVLDCNALSEYNDGYDTVEWIAAQPWCSGRVGMFGLSYFGFTQIAAAVMAPKALAAICPFMTQAMEPFGSQMTQTFNYGHICWIYGQLMSQLDKYLPDPEQRAALEPVLRGHAAKLNDYAILLPADRNPAVVEGVPLLHDYFDLISGMENKDFWDHLRHPTDFSAAHTAMFHCTGWFDVCLNTTIHNWEGMMATADEYTRENARLLIGPWFHGGFGTADGPFDFGPENDGDGQDVNGQMLAWFDRHIKQKTNAVCDWPKVRYFMLGSNRWRSSSVWPPAESRMTPFYLHENGVLNADAPGAEAPDTFTYDPMDPAPAYAPSADPRLDPLPDYRVLADRADTVTYETPALLSPLNVAGTVRLRLFASTDAADTDFTCRLVDVYPDGREFLLNQGLLRGKWRKGFFVLDPLTPGEPAEFDIEVGNVGCCVLPGHKLKIHVSSALFPLYDRNLNTGEPNASCDHCVTAHQTLWHDAAHPSTLMLPILPD